MAQSHKDDEVIMDALRIIWDLYFILRELEEINRPLVDPDSGLEVECDWGYWADKCAEILEFEMPKSMVN